MDIQTIEDKIIEIGGRIARLLAQDAGYFFRQTVRTQFAEHPDVADKLDDEEIARLKRWTYESAKSVSEHVAGQLSGSDLWLGAEPTGDTKRPVSELAAVAEVIEHVQDQLDTFLKSHRLTPEALIEWRLPARFIDSDHLPTLTETYWKYMSRRAGLIAEARAQADRQSSVDRLRRWDEA